MIGSGSQSGPQIVVAANKNQDKYALENSALDYNELKQLESMIHMIKKKIMKPQLVSINKATNKDAKDICVKVLIGKNGND